MKYIKLFEQFINESGNAIQDSVPFKQSQIGGTIDWCQKNIFSQIGLEGLGVDCAVIGSAGKKKADATSGDIDIAVSADKIAVHFNTSLGKAVFALNDALVSMGHSTKMIHSLNQVSIAAPIDGDYKNGVGQVDLMLSNNLTWSTFMYHSPDFTRDESKYKGAYRNILLMSAIGDSFFKTTKETDKKEIAEYEAYVIRLNQGVVKVRKSFEGKRGLVKNAKLLKEFDELITDEPKELVNLLFKGDFEPDDINTYEKLKTLLESPHFKYPQKLDTILKKFKINLDKNNLPHPEDI